MYSIITLFFDIALLKKGPQDVPASAVLARLIMLAYALVNFLILAMNGHWLDALLQVAIEIALLMAFTWAALYWARKPARVPQTVTALMGSDALISFCAIPAMATLTLHSSAIAFVVVVLMMLWHWVVTGHIFRHALSSSLVFGLGLAFLYILTSYQILSLLFPNVAE